MPRAFAKKKSDCDGNARIKIFQLDPALVHHRPAIERNRISPVVISGRCVIFGL